MLFWENMVKGVSKERKGSKETTCWAHYWIWWFYLAIGFTAWWLQFQATYVVAAACVADSPCPMVHMWLHAASFWLLGLGCPFSASFSCLWGCGTIFWIFSKEAKFVPIPLKDWGFILVTSLSTSLPCSFRCTANSLKPSDPSDPSVGWGNDTWRYRLWRGREDLRERATTCAPSEAGGHGWPGSFLWVRTASWGKAWYIDVY